ncbi:type II and III secretion system protein family protein [Trinickia acidisoli]|uniref:type II and III secretion system protein family protein n=1 Tax=Trinickia acidisoli TaxID=2767482 RepID=UPI001F5D1F9F|nr:type II and III secretion system protein family protein [Trinickia acidisoli]
MTRGWFILVLACFAFAARASEPLTVTAGAGAVVKLPEPAVAVFVADPDVADIHVPTPGAIFVVGKKEGQTTLFALGRDNRVILREAVTVKRDLGRLDTLLHDRFPHLKLTLASAPGSLMVSGNVDTASDVDAIVRTLTPALTDKDTLINHLVLAQPTQVYLRVRMVEVDRNVTQQLGVNWNAAGSIGNFVVGLMSGRTIQDPTTGAYQLPTTAATSVLSGFKTANSSVQNMIDALDQDGLLTVLAEPNLTVLSGQTASFLAGGEFPIPIAQQQGTISVEFKPFGVSLAFTPTVLADDRISLKVRPEVSEIDPTTTVTTNSITVPGLSIRRVETTVELASGQSFAIGGLLQDETRDIISQLPGLGKLPILGRLFSSKDYQNNKTELVVIVTPYLVHPASPAQMSTPLDSVLTPSTDVETILQRKTGLDPMDGKTPRLVGAAGFIY